MSAASYPPSMRRLVNELMKLPSVGEKSAIRLAYFLVSNDDRVAMQLSDAIRDARERVRLCRDCFSLTEDECCTICSDGARVRSLICAVEKPADVMAVERSGGYRGLYHVLHGLWSPLRGLGPEKTKVRELIERISRGGFDELLIATSTTVEGDATALFIANSVRHLPMRVSRIAQGIPKGGELDYADEITLTHAIEGRREL